VSMDEHGPDCFSRAEDVWATLQVLHERVVRSLARGDEYDLLLRASGDAEALLASHAADVASVREPDGYIEDAPLRKAA
jgi:hypothetical protein